MRKLQAKLKKILYYIGIQIEGDHNEALSFHILPLYDGYFWPSVTDVCDIWKLSLSHTRERPYTNWIQFQNGCCALCNNGNGSNHILKVIVLVLTYLFKIHEFEIDSLNLTGEILFRVHKSHDVIVLLKSCLWGSHLEATQADPQWAIHGPQLVLVQVIDLKLWRNVVKYWSGSFQKNLQE